MTMTGKIFSLMLGVPAVAVGLIGSVGTANAVSLTSPFAALPDPSELSFTSSLVVTGVLDGEGNLLGSEFNFGDPFGGPPPTANIGALEADIDLSAGSGIGGFVGFNTLTGGSPDGLITDSIVLGDGTTVPDPLVLVQLFSDETGAGTPEDDTFFTATEVDVIPTFEQVGNDLIVTLGAEGFWTSPDGTFEGTFIGTSQYVNTDQETFLGDLASGIPITPANGVSVTVDAFEPPPDIDIPEPTSTIAALLAMGLGAVSLKKRQKQAN